MKSLYLFLILPLIYVLSSCSPVKAPLEKSAADILGNKDYPAICYGGYRSVSRESVPSVEQIKDDLRILSAMGIRIVRTYNTQHYPHAANLLKAIQELGDEEEGFEMYVMLGTWIECKGAWGSDIDHNQGNDANNRSEIDAAVRLVNQYPDIVKIIAVGNEAMIHWAANYYVSPAVILKWVSYLQDQKRDGGIPASTWITSSDNFAAWGGEEEYRTADLAELVSAVDYISLHTYPYHETFYHPGFWNIPPELEKLSEPEQTDAAMNSALAFAQKQYGLVKEYVESLGVQKALHIGETGWSTTAISAFGASGSRAADEYKQAGYYRRMRDWTDSAGISCFFFEAFDEQWKDSGTPGGSENHFGLLNLDGQAKYALWPLVDSGAFSELQRDGRKVAKTFNGDEAALMATVLPPPLVRDAGLLEIVTVNNDRKAGEKVSEAFYVLCDASLVPDGSNDMSYPSSKISITAWDGSCSLKLTLENIIELKTGTGTWWGGALELQSGNRGEDLSAFAGGNLCFEMKGDTRSVFLLGFQTGKYAQGNQVGNYVRFGPGEAYSVDKEWKKVTIKIRDLDKGADLSNVTAPIYFMGEKDFDGGKIELRNIYWEQ